MYHYRPNHDDPSCKDKVILRLFYVCNVISFNGKMAFYTEIAHKFLCEKESLSHNHYVKSRDILIMSHINQNAYFSHSQI